MGFPIRTSRDQRVLSPPPGLSQSATSFIASCCQGIHQTPLSRLIRSRRRRALLREVLVRNLNPLPLRSEVDSTRRTRRHAGNGNDLAIDAAFSVSVIDLERLSWLPCRLAPRGQVPEPPNAGRVRTPTRAGPRTSRVIALFTMSLCRMSPSGGQKLPRSRDRTGRPTRREPANRIVPIGSSPEPGNGGSGRS